MSEAYGPVEGAQSDATVVHPLSAFQAGLWVHHRVEPNSVAYHGTTAIRLRHTELDLSALKKAWRWFFDRHEGLRTTFHEVDGTPLQRTHRSYVPELRVIDASGLDEAALDPLVHADYRRPFDLGRGSVRASVYRCSDSDHVILIVTHHIAFDLGSADVMHQELPLLYAAARKGDENPLPMPSTPYAEFVAWQSAMLVERGDEMGAYWEKQLASPPERLEMPADHPRATDQSRGASHTVVIEGQLANGLRALKQTCGSTLFRTLLCAYFVLLRRYTNADDLIVATPADGRSTPAFENAVGDFVNMLVLRVDVSGNPSFRSLLGRVDGVVREAVKRRDYPLLNLLERLHPARSGTRRPLYQTSFGLNRTRRVPDLSAHMIRGAPWRAQLGELGTVEPYPISQQEGQLEFSLWGAEVGEELWLELKYDPGMFEVSTIERMGETYQTLLAGIAADPDAPIDRLPFIGASERARLLIEWNQTAQPVSGPATVHEQIFLRAAAAEDATALVFQRDTMTFGDLARRARALAAELRALGVGPDTRVVVCMERSLEMVVALVGVLAAGGAYVPVDPTYPRDRLAFMMQDSGAAVLITQSRLRGLLGTEPDKTLLLDPGWTGSDSSASDDAAKPAEGAVAAGADLAYVIYTSGSTGNPKGVMVSHANVINFFEAMDRRLGADASTPGTWLALTSISFDISVLELLWTLSRGFKVVVQGEQAPSVAAARKASRRPIDFSLLYFSNDDGLPSRQKYELLIEGAKFADRRGFHAVWTPERHFHPFGGTYPNPSVVSAALAVLTERVRIRAGSVNLPLHDPIRVAEEWGVVDNLSNGRVDLAFATGWQPNDFVFHPENFADRREVTVRNIETVKKLWRGDAVSVRNGKGETIEVRTYPRPVQPELACWLTAAGAPETFEAAGRAGTHLLTHLLGQTLEQLDAKLRVYHEAWAKEGHRGRGRVTVMLHTYVDRDLELVREKVRGPFTAYLRSSVDLMKNLAASMGTTLDPKSMAPADLDALLAHAFDRYFETSGLLGTPATCMKMVDRLREVGVDEIACLVDFGVDNASVLASLEYLDLLRQEANSDHSVPAQIERHGVTHLQCTPSMCSMLLTQYGAELGLDRLAVLLLGGEALPTTLLPELASSGTPSRVLNMYGPTETTIWSTCHDVDVADWTPQALASGAAESNVSIGTPIANTATYVVDAHLQPVPIGVAGELLIGGAGVARGYLNRPELTAERFLDDPFRPNARVYRTGDLVRWRRDGSLEFLGRTDHQVKLRGHRIELGEIEAVLGRHPQVRQAVVVLRRDPPGDARIVAYLVPRDAPPPIEELRALLRSRLPDAMMPSAFHVLEQLPLTPNGKVDRRALPAPDSAQRPEGRRIVGPRTPLEHTIHELWCTLLGRAPSALSVDDDFFHVGGHSLLMMKLQADLERLTGKPLALARVFEKPTIEHLARTLDAAGVATSTVRLDSAAYPPAPGSSSQPPLFIVHPMGGDVFALRELAAILRPTPVYGVRARGIDGDAEPLTRIEQMAAHYLRDVRALQPDGPYRLAGWSLGGLIALEMAQQLHAVRERATVLILDCNDLAPAPELMDLDEAGLRTLFESEQGRAAKDAPAAFAVLRANIEALRHYVPKPYPATIALFRATEPGDTEASRGRAGRAQISTERWTSLAAGGVEVHRVPGDHFTMLAHPNVAELAGSIRKCLDVTAASSSSA